MLDDDKVKKVLKEAIKRPQKRMKAIKLMNTE